jgi:hypothetical protein
MTTTPIESIVAESVADGSIEFKPVPVLIEILEHLPQPTMLVGANMPTDLSLAREKGWRISTARTLRLAMNLLVDGWCQIVWLYAEISGRIPPDNGVAIIHQVGAKQLAILVSVLPHSTPGVFCRRKPESATEFTALLQQIEGN